MRCTAYKHRHLPLVLPPAREGLAFPSLLEFQKRPVCLNCTEREDLALALKVRRSQKPHIAVQPRMEPV